MYPNWHVGWHVDPDASLEVQLPTAPFAGATEASQSPAIDFTKKHTMPIFVVWGSVIVPVTPAFDQTLKCASPSGNVELRAMLVNDQPALARVEE
jgi:hypothetical protein